LRTLLAQHPPAEPPALRATRLKLAAELAASAEQAQPLLEASLALYREIGDHPRELQVLTHLANVFYERGDVPKTWQLQRELLALARATGDKAQLANVLHNLGDLAREEGDYPGATAWYTESLALYREQGMVGGVASSFTGMGDLALYQGDLPQAQAWYDAAFDLFQGEGNQLMLAWLLRNLGRLAHLQGDDGAARALLTESLARFHRDGMIYGIGCCLDALAGVASSEGQPERAAHLYGAGQALRWGTYHRALRPRWPMGARVDYERDVAAVRSRLSESAFAGAWSEGKAMTLEQAVAYALEPTATFP
jgi:tetratricopeptide (TPR) repeat protein